MVISVFGRKPADSIFLADHPYAVRNDCQVGQWKIGDDDFRGSTVEISIIRICRFFGNLGKSRNTFWLQLWFVPAPATANLPRNTVCVSYLKTRSVSEFSRKIIELMDAGEPAEGIFTGSFAKHSSELGNYYSVRWDWRDRSSEAELRQLEQIGSFLDGQPQLLDLTGTRDMVSLDGLSEPEIQLLAESAKAGRVELLPAG